VKIVQLLRFAASGWLAGMLAVVLLSLVWPNFFPGFVNYKHYIPTGPAPNLIVFVVFVLVAASLPAIIGGVIGGRIPKEGGRSQQLLVAAIFGILFALPCGCYGLWTFSGA